MAAKAASCPSKHDDLLAKFSGGLRGSVVKLMVLVDHGEHFMDLHGVFVDSSVDAGFGTLRLNLASLRTLGSLCFLRELKMFLQLLEPSSLPRAGSMRS